MTFGVMPSFTEFAAAVGPGTYSIEAHSGSEDARALRRARVNPVGVGAYGKNRYELTAKQLYRVVKKLGESSSEEAMSLASGIMTTLGYEWI